MTNDDVMVEVILTLKRDGSFQTSTRVSCEIPEKMRGFIVHGVISAALADFSKNIRAEPVKSADES